MTAALVAMLIVLAPAATAHATAPVDLGGTYVLDEADALTAPQQARVEQAVQDLYAETQTQLYVVFVPSFSDPTDHTEWGRAVLEKNQIDSGGILLSVAVTERNYDVQQTNETAISSSDVENAVNDALLPELKQDDWSGAAVAFADGLTQSQAPVDLTWLWILLLVVVVGLVVVVLVIRTRNKRRTAAATEAQEASLADLERTAGGALVTIDDELRTAEQEVGFASAQFGPRRRQALRRRRAGRPARGPQGLHDPAAARRRDPRHPPARAEWANQIIVICERAHAAIEEQTEAFDQLRSLEDGVEDAAASLAQAVAAAPASVGSAAAALDRVRARYTGRTLATVANNVDQAHQVLAFATGTLQRRHRLDRRRRQGRGCRRRARRPARPRPGAAAHRRRTRRRAVLRRGHRPRRGDAHRHPGRRRRRPQPALRRPGPRRSGHPRRSRAPPGARPEGPGRRRRRPDPGEHRDRPGHRRGTGCRGTAPARHPGARRRPARRPEPDQPGP
ncbi:TPM domain-containing protein [Curtobacterium flaccumfaciens]|nr:TPM domain-containing protein [Curtobacterium flaccumfaciens]